MRPVMVAPIVVHLSGGRDRKLSARKPLDQVKTHDHAIAGPGLTELRVTLA